MRVIHPAESLIQTVRIKSILDTGDTSVGTGFLYAFFARKIDGKTRWGVRAIVTNRHVIQKKDVKVKSGHFYFNRRDESGNCLYGDKVKIEFTGDDWIHNASDGVDLSIMLMGDKIKKLEEEGEKLFLSNNLYEIVPISEEEWSRVGPLEDIVSVGYPNGLWDENNNSPISRKGMTATFPKLNYHNKEEFVIDMPIFPGISGSPVYAYSYGMEIFYCYIIKIHYLLTIL